MGAVSCAFMYDLADSSETALRYIEEALKIYGDNIPSTIYAIYGSILTNLGEYEKAEKILYEGMNKVSPDNIYQSTAELMMKTGRYNEAISLHRLIHITEIDFHFSLWTRSFLESSQSKFPIVNRNTISVKSSYI